MLLGCYLECLLEGTFEYSFKVLLLWVLACEFNLVSLHEVILRSWQEFFFDVEINGFCLDCLELEKLKCEEKRLRE